jgi:hypothetical protein
VAAGATALALVVATGGIASQRERALTASPLPTVENVGPRGLAAARAWLAATGRPHRVLAVDGAGPSLGEVLLLVAPPSAVSEREAAALVAHAERGGLVVWAMGGTPQPALERRLGVSRASAGSDDEEHAASPLAPHPLFDAITLRTGGASLRANGRDALPVAGELERVSAASIPVGAGEVVVLAGADPLENLRLGAGGNLALLSRLAAVGPIAFDERHLARTGDPGARAWGGHWPLAAQALLAASVLLVALGRRLGAVRTPAGTPEGFTVRDYLASLAGLYRRAAAERELRASAWRAVREQLERRAGIAARVPDDEVLRRLAIRSPEAARAYELGLAALRGPPSEATFLAVARAAGELEVALGRRPPPRAGT